MFEQIQKLCIMCQNFQKYIFITDPSFAKLILAKKILHYSLLNTAVVD